MKQFYFLCISVLFLASCSSVNVATDYDTKVNFNNYKTFAFYKPGIDKATINDLDKRRIMHAIETELTAKGMTKSENPDMLISLFTKSRKQVNIYNNGTYGYGWGWRPYYWNGYNNVSRSTQGQLYIDFIDANAKQLVWQGKGSGYLVTSDNVEKKTARIKEFVNLIIAKYPPQ